MIFSLLSLLPLLPLLSLLGVTLALPYDPRVEVKADCRDPASPCEFVWRVTEKETMVYYNLTQGKGWPLLQNTTDGVWYRRDDANCSHRQALDQTQLDEVATADGTFRRAYFINDQFPGPNIVVHEGQEVIVRVTNGLLQEGLSIHWHGMVMRNTNWMDGVAGVTQCNINQEETFTYRFIASPAGTHWYHSHLGAQRTDGLYGALIVLPRQPAPRSPALPEFAADYVVMVQDWYHKESSVIWTQYSAELQAYWDGYSNLDHCHVRTQMVDGTEVGTLPFEAGLINGKGHFFMDKGARAEVDVPVETFTAERNTFVRFRLINPGLNFAFQISIDNHQLHVISSDGNEMEVIVADQVLIHGGERYDFYIETNQTVDNYWIRASTIERFEGFLPDTPVVAEEPGRIFAILRYQGAEAAQPSSETKRCTPENQCHYVNCPYREYPDGDNIMCHNVATFRSLTNYSLSDTLEIHQEMLNFHFPRTPVGPLRSSVNDIQFILPQTPPAVHGAANFEKPCTTECDETHCVCTHQKHVPLGHMVQMVLMSTVTPTPWVGVPASAHPVHLHGHHFYVMKVAYPIINETTKIYAEPNPDFQCHNDRHHNCTWRNRTWLEDPDTVPGLNKVNPPLKDTVIVPVGGYVVIRFEADNPGWWIMHCHVEIHQIEGMALLIQEGEPTNMNPPPSDFPSCGTFNWSEEEFREKLKGRQPGFWNQYGIWIVVALAVVLALAIIIILALIWRRKAPAGYESIR